MEYRWRGPEGELVSARPYELAERYGLAKQSVKAMAAGRQLDHRGWRCLTPRRQLAIGSRSNGARVVRLHRWRRLDQPLTVIETVEGLAARYDLSARCVWAVGRGVLLQHQGWVHDGQVAEWPRRRVALVGPGGQTLEKTPLQLYRELGSTEEVDALLAGREVHGLRLRERQTGLPKPGGQDRRERQTAGLDYPPGRNGHRNAPVAE